MTDRTERIEEVFAAALALDPEERAAYVGSALDADDAARSEVLSLLAAAERDPRFLVAPVPLPSARPGTLVPERLGPWRLVREIGAGGMGSVWLAERDDRQYRARAAVKLIHAALLSGAQREDVLRRFAEERQTLADLDHAWIARLLDGGEAPDGSPYLVMEYVDGAPLDRFCDEQRLNRADRLRLFVRICRAVQYAHGRLVAHRDLKPANVLVRRGADGAAEPKLLDFGIARLLAGTSGEVLQRTTMGSSRLTPAYASPEQFRGEPATAQSDVYSLGVILFELLTGALPYDLVGPLPAVIRRVCEEPPRRASQLDARLAGDLETIAAKAIAKEPRERYVNVGELLEDVERHLLGHPIRARPATRWERFAKTVRRNPLPFALAAGLFVSISALSVWLGALYRRSVRAEESADARREHAERTSEILRQLLVAPNPFATRGRDVRVVDVLDDSAPRVLAGLTGQPQIRGELSRLVGDTYRSLGAYEEAERHLRQAFEDARTLHGEVDELTLSAASDLSSVELKLGRIDEAERRMRAVVDAAQRKVGADRLALLPYYSNLSAILRETNQPAEAETHARACFDGRARQLGIGHPETLQALNQLASVLTDLGRWQESAELVRRGLEGEAALPERNPAMRLAFLVQLAHAERWMGQLAQSYARIAAVLDERRLLLGPDHPDTLEAETFAAESALQLGRIDEAEALLRHAIEAYERSASNAPLLVQAHLLQCDLLLQRDRIEEAEAAAQAGFALAIDRLGPGHWLTLHARTKLWIVPYESGRPALAELRLREQIEAYRDVYGPLHRDVLTGEGNLATALMRQGRLEEAEDVLRALLVKFAEAGLSGSVEEATYSHNLALVLQSQGRLTESELVLCTTFDAARESLGENNLNTAWVRASHARVLAQLGRDEAATEAFEDAWERFDEALPPGHPRRVRHLEEMRDFFERVGPPERHEIYRQAAEAEAAGS